MLTNIPAIIERTSNMAATIAVYFKDLFGQLATGSKNIYFILDKTYIYNLIYNWIIIKLI